MSHLFYMKIVANVHKIFLLMLLIIVPACSMSVPPLSESQRMERVKLTLENIFPERTLVDKEMSLEEAMARALKYNIDVRIRLQEDRLANTQYALSQIDLLPSLNAEVGVSKRNSSKGAKSEEIGTGIQNLNFSRSSEDRTVTARLSTTYGILEYGLNFVRAKQNANRIQISREKRRAIIHDIMSEVRVAFMRAAIAEHVEKDIMLVKNEAEKALERARIIHEKNISIPIKNLTYQRNLIQTIKELNSLQAGLESSKVELAALLNVRFGDNFRLKSPDVDVKDLPLIKPSLDQLEIYALVNRPELAEEDYNYNIESLERKKHLLSLIPFPTHSLSLDYDHNKFLLNSSWISIGGQLSYNLLQPLLWSKQNKENEERLELIKSRRDALTLVVLAQVNIAYLQHLSAIQTFRDSAKLAELEKAISNLVESAVLTKTDNEQELVFSHARSLLARVQRNIDYIELNNSLAQIITSIGFDPIPQEMESYDIKHLAKIIDEHHRGLFMNLSASLPVPSYAHSEQALKSIAFDAAYRTIEKKPWLVRTGLFSTQNDALAAEKSIKAALKAHSTNKIQKQAVLSLRTNENLAKSEYYIAFDELKGCSQDDICTLLHDINLSCEVFSVPLENTVRRKKPNKKNGLFSLFNIFDILQEFDKSEESSICLDEPNTDKLLNASPILPSSTLLLKKRWVTPITSEKLLLKSAQ